MKFLLAQSSRLRIGECRVPQGMLSIRSAQAHTDDNNYLRSLTIYVPQGCDTVRIAFVQYTNNRGCGKRAAFIGWSMGEA